MTNSKKQPKSQGKKVQSDPFKVKLICSFIGFFSAMPAFVGTAFAWLFALLSKLFNTRSYSTTMRNLSLCMADKSPSERKELAKKSLKHTGKLFFEVAKIWKKNRGEYYLDKIHGEELVREQLSKKQGVLFTGSHIGNWEVALYYLGSRYPFHCMYRPPRQQEMDEVISGGRCQNDTTMVKGDSRGVMHLINALKNGEVAAVLSDQEPGRRAGVFVPFCGKDALTMTIVQRIQQRSDAKLFQVAAIKNDNGLYDMHLVPIEIDAEQAQEQYAKEVNEHLESFIRQYPEQYQWSYKRFKTSSCGGPNPYQK
ncbi:lipid A biosynthesis acyltransferase [Kangiella sp. HD9-110m-PIT-SAG07]|nr:lipid A biosynthesis acyltransferase [Kangiella sp. HD9-110m-PIT-SAG07]